MNLLYLVVFWFQVMTGMPVSDAGYTVTWVAPTENTDGSPLTDLAGYKLWCLYAENDYGNPAIIPPEDTRYVKDWAGPGDWKCKMRAFNTAGVDSADSQEVFFTLVDTDGDGNAHTRYGHPPSMPRHMKREAPSLSPSAPAPLPRLILFHIFCKVSPYFWTKVLLNLHPLTPGLKAGAIHHSILSCLHHLITLLCPR